MTLGFDSAVSGARKAKVTVTAGLSLSVEGCCCCADVSQPSFDVQHHLRENADERRTQNRSLATVLVWWIGWKCICRRLEFKISAPQQLRAASSSTGSKASTRAAAIVLKHFPSAASVMDLC